MGYKVVWGNLLHIVGSGPALDRLMGELLAAGADLREVRIFAVIKGADGVISVAGA
jgi:hypothetical protein